MELFFDGIIGELIEGNEVAIYNIMSDRINEYKINKQILSSGRTFVNGVAVWFVRGLDKDFSRIELENIVTNYLGNK